MPHVSLPFKTLFACCAATLLLSACGGGHDVAPKAGPIFKGTVSKVRYMVTENKTIIVDSEGKELTLEGMPGIPCTEIEIHHGHGHHPYEVFLASEPFKVE